VQTPTTQQPAKAQHTPGPWAWSDGHTLRAVTPNPDASSVHTILSSDGRECGYLGSNFRATLAELDADKQLIAAAPDLLEALIELRDCTTYWNVPLGIVAHINDAITKATGAAA